MNYNCLYTVTIVSKLEMPQNYYYFHLTAVFPGEPG